MYHQLSSANQVHAFYSNKKSLCRYLPTYQQIYLNRVSSLWKMHLCIFQIIRPQGRIRVSNFSAIVHHSCIHLFLKLTNLPPTSCHFQTYLCKSSSQCNGILFRASFLLSFHLCSNHHYLSKVRHFPNTCASDEDRRCSYYKKRPTF